MKKTFFKTLGVLAALVLVAAIALPLAQIKASPQALPPHVNFGDANIGTTIPAGESRDPGTTVVLERVDYDAKTIDVKAFTLTEKTEFGVFGRVHVNGWENYPDLETAKLHACKQAQSRMLDVAIPNSWNENFRVTLDGTDPTGCTPDTAPVATGVIELHGSVPAGTLVVIEVVNNNTKMIDVSFLYLAVTTQFGTFGDVVINGWSGYTDTTQALRDACGQAHERMTEPEFSGYTVTLLGGLVPDVCPVACIVQ